MKKIFKKLFFIIKLSCVISTVFYLYYCAAIEDWIELLKFLIFICISSFLLAVDFFETIWWKIKKVFIHDDFD